MYRFLHEHKTSLLWNKGLGKQLIGKCMLSFFKEIAEQFYKVAMIFYLHSLCVSDQFLCTLLAFGGVTIF